MAMQQSSKGVSGTGSNPALSDEQAEQFAASFTPAWDADDGPGDSNNGMPDATAATAAIAAMGTESTQVMDRAELTKAQEAAAPPIVGMPAIIFNAKSTMIGVPLPATLAARPAAAPVSVPPPPPAPPAPSVAEAIESANVLEVAPAPAAAPVHQNHGMRTQIMQNRPAGLGAPPPAPRGAATIAARPPNERTAAAVPNADPFRNKGPSSDDLDAFPRRSNKGVFFVVGGLAVAAGLGLFLKFALGDDTPKPAPAEVVTGPAVTTAEIPPPPPKDETPPAPSAPAAELAPPPLATPLATPPHAAVEPPHVAAEPAAQPPPRAAAPVAAAPPRNEPRAARGPSPAALPPPATAAPPGAATPKSAPKASNGGIVRDNPF